MDVRWNAILQLAVLYICIRDGIHERGPAFVDSHPFDTHKVGWIGDKSTPTTYSVDETVRGNVTLGSMGIGPPQLQDGRLLSIIVSTYSREGSPTATGRGVFTIVHGPVARPASNVKHTVHFSPLLV